MTDRHTRTLSDIAARSRAVGERFRPPRFTTIELDQPFVPESFTQLYHTPLYQRLDDRQRLRYNQLYGLRTNELFMLFEQGFTRRVIQRIAGACRSTDPMLSECLWLMLEEESRHHRMFLDFNRRVLPAAYADRHGHFARALLLERGLLWLLTVRPDRWPFLLWLILMLEEFSTAFSRLLIAQQPIDALAPAYVRLHRLHLLDEERHVHLDETLVEQYFAALPATRLARNAAAFKRLLHALLAPRRSGIRVLQTLGGEQPSLRPLLPHLIDAVRALPHDPGLYGIITDPVALPFTHRLQARFPAFALDRGR